MNFNQLFEEFQGLKVVILGDSMLDAYFYGKVDRISPEAPVPIVNLQHKEHRLGGAANVALNVKALGATPILCTLKGNDRDGETLKQLIANLGISTDGLINDYNRGTTVKTRIIGNNHQMLRIDEEETHDIDSNVEGLLYEAVKHFVKDAHVLIMQDYNKGLLTASLISRIIALCKKEGVKTVVDPKFDQFFDYKGVDLFKPNKKEIAQAFNKARISSHEAIELSKELREKLEAGSVLTTLSEDGAALVSAGETVHVPAHPRKVVDVSGAGDSALSAAALCIALETPEAVVAEIANLAGGLVCEQVGVVPIDRDALLDEVLELGITQRLYRTDNS